MDKIGLEVGKVGKYIIEEIVDVDRDIYTKSFSPEGRWMRYYNQFIGRGEEENG